MAFVPGFDHDVFVSYAHGDNRDWINRFLDRLRPALSRLLPGADIWIDKDDLRKSRNFEQDIPANLASSAVLISLVSPIYVDRPDCVREECRRFTALAAASKQAHTLPPRSLLRIFSGSAARSCLWRILPIGAASYPARPTASGW